MACVSIAPTNQNRTERGFKQEADSGIGRQSRLVGNAISFADLVHADGIDFARKERRFFDKAVKIASAKEEKLIGQYFIATVGSKAKRSTEAERRQSLLPVVEVSSPRSSEEDSRRIADWLEGTQ